MARRRGQGWQPPFTHLLEQHCAFMKQPKVPFFMHPHAVLLHCIEQHCEALKQNVPSAWHGGGG